MSYKYTDDITQYSDDDLISARALAERDHMNIVWSHRKITEADKPIAFIRAVNTEIERRSDARS